MMIGKKTGKSTEVLASTIMSNSSTCTEHAHEYDEVLNTNTIMEQYHITRKNLCTDDCEGKLRKILSH